MIKAETVKYLTTLSARHIEAIGLNSGYRDLNIRQAEFLGLTTGGDFCYSTMFFDDIEGELLTGKVFVKYDPASDRATLEF